MANKNKANSTSKVESVEEYLARGGSIQRLPQKSRDREVEVVRKTGAAGPAIFLSLDEADLFYGEARKGSKPKKAKPSLRIDLEALPPALRAKFIAKLKEEVDGEGYEEELEDLEEELDEEEDSE